MLRLPTPHPDTPSFDAIERALEALAPDTARRWGTMDAAAMLEHNARFVDLYLGRVRVGAPLRFAARWIGPPFLRRLLKGSPLETPRNLRTLGPLRVEGSDAEFAASRDRLRAGLREIAELDGEVRHALYGPMDAAGVRDLVRHHTAHHLCQFGLLGSPQAE